MEEKKIKPVITVRAAKERVFLGPGVIMIMESLLAAGAMKEACHLTGISYSKAWRILNEVEKQAGCPVVVRQHGGQNGGGCMVTPEGRAMIEKYREAERRIKVYAEQVFADVFYPVEQNLRDVLSVCKGDIISLTGAGGKTACLFRLGEECRYESVLLTTTTKMKYPLKNQVDCVFSEADIQKKPWVYQKGRTFLYGTLLQEEKCGAVSRECLKKIAPNYDIVIIEADGSRGQPLKGYLNSEPCIPEFATVNVGIVTGKMLGKPADDASILREDALRKMINIKADEPISEMHLAKWIAHPDGMFKGSRGRRILFWNQVESEVQLMQVKRIIKCLDESFLAGLSKVIAGSVKNRSFQVLWCKEAGR